MKITKIKTAKENPSQETNEQNDILTAKNISQEDSGKKRKFAIKKLK